MLVATLLCSKCRAEFKEIRLLGTGNFSKVYLAQHRLDGVNYAVKRSAHRVCSDAAKRQWVQVSYASLVLLGLGTLTRCTIESNSNREAGSLTCIVVAWAN